MFIESGSAGPHRHVLNGKTMGTRYSAIFYWPSDVMPEGLESELFEAVDRVDRQMSTFQLDSTLVQLNLTVLNTWFNVPRELFTVLETALRIGKESGGVFDPAVGDITASEVVLGGI